MSVQLYKRSLKNESASIKKKKKKKISGVDFAGSSPTFIHLLPQLHIKQPIASHLEERDKASKKECLAKPKSCSWAVQSTLQGQETLPRTWPKASCNTILDLLMHCTRRKTNHCCGEKGGALLALSNRHARCPMTPRMEIEQIESSWEAQWNLSGTWAATLLQATSLSSKSILGQDSLPYWHPNCKLPTHLLTEPTDC